MNRTDSTPLIYIANRTGNGAESGAAGDASEPIAAQLRDHQAGLNDWYADLICDFQVWTERFVIEFNIGLPAIPIFGVEGMRSAYAYYMPGRSEIGTKDNIRFNVKHLDRAPGLIYGTLLHELLHLEQQYCGKPGARNYHNRQYRDRGLDCGLIVDGWGCTNGYTSVFTDVLDKYGVRMEPYVAADETGPPLITAAAASPLKTWRCSCSRVLTEDALDARCLACGSAFVRSYRGSRRSRGKRRCAVTRRGRAHEG